MTGAKGLIGRGVVRWVLVVLAAVLAVPQAASAHAYDDDTYGYDATDNLARKNGFAAGRPYWPELGGDAGFDAPSKLASAEVASAPQGFFAPQTAARALPRSSLPSPAEAADLVRGANPVGSALKSDVYHRSATWAVDDIASSGSVFKVPGRDGVLRTLVQSPGELNNIAGRFEWMVDEAGNLTHQMFVKGGSINGMPITP